MSCKRFSRLFSLKRLLKVTNRLSPFHVVCFLYFSFVFIATVSGSLWPTEPSTGQAELILKGVISVFIMLMRLTCASKKSSSHWTEQWKHKVKMQLLIRKLFNGVNDQRCEEKWNRKASAAHTSYVDRRNQKPACSVEVSLIPALARVSSEPAAGVMAAFAMKANISENTNPCFTLRWDLDECTLSVHPISTVSHRDVPDASAKWAGASKLCDQSSPPPSLRCSFPTLPAVFRKLF